MTSICPLVPRGDHRETYQKKINKFIAKTLFNYYRKIVHMKSSIFVGTKQNIEEILKVSKDIAFSLNKTNNIETIKPNMDGDIYILDDYKMFLQVGGGKSTNGKYFDVIFFYGKEEETIQSFNYECYNDFIQQVVNQVNDVFNKHIKVVTYSVKRKCYGKKWFRLNPLGEWELYESFEFNGFFSRIFISKSYEDKDVYDFTYTKWKLS